MVSGGWGLGCTLDLFQWLTIGAAPSGVCCPLDVILVLGRGGGGESDDGIK